MDLSGLRALALGLNFSAHGVDAIVTKPDEDPVTTRGIWVTPATDGYPGSVEFGRQEARKVLALPRAGLVTVPRGTRIEAPDRQGGDAQDWIVDGTDRMDVDHVRVLVVLDPEAE